MEKGKGKHLSKKTIIKTIVCFGLVVLIWGGYFLAARYWIIVKADDFSWVYQVDAVEEREKEIILSGFAFQLDVDSADERYEIILQDITSGENLFPKMEYSERKDVNDYFLCEYDYLHSGYQAVFQGKKLDLQNKDYEVLLRAHGKQVAYRTGTYLSKGELMYANPKEYVPLEVAGTDLEEIVEKSVLRVYRPDYGMYVYQYEGELYWIAEPEYGFVEGDTYVQYHLNTTQIERLPQHRLENQWYWDNIGFMFRSNECVALNTGKYRVTKKALPKEYSIKRIETGNYIEGWIWKQDFRPYYE